MKKYIKELIVAFLLILTPFFTYVLDEYLFYYITNPYNSYIDYHFGISLSWIITALFLYKATKK